MDENDRQDAYDSESTEPIEPKTAPAIPGAARTAIAGEPTKDDFSEAPVELNPGLESTEVIPEPIESGDETRLEVAVEDTQQVGESSDATQIAPERGSKKRLLMIALAIVMMVATLGVLGWWLFAGTPEPSASRSEDISSAPIEQPKLGVAITVADGTVEYQRRDAVWQAVDTTTELQEGDSVRTGDGSRAVLTLDDGSAIRLDANTSVTLVNLTAGQVEIEQGSGAVYSRVVPSERVYIVRADGTDYKALGTAFMTTVDDKISGVYVFQSAVKTNDLPDDVTIGEGKQYFRPVGDYVGSLEVVDINLDELAGNDFVGWNLERDQEDATFKTKLGVLPRIKERSETLREELAAEEERREQAEQKAFERAEEEEREAEAMRAHTSGERIKRGTMVLSSIGKTLHWSYTGKAYHGYKLVYSRTSESPLYGRDKSVYYDDMGDTSGSLPSKDKIGGGKYYVRVCAYTDGTEADECVDYSNIVIVNV